MDDVAAAGVGKGTLYRRFTDKGGLAIALLDERERELQQLILTGPPPLGPGADPADRLASFVAGYLAFLDRQLDLVLSQTATVGARLRTGAHAFWRQHCRYLLAKPERPNQTSAPTYSLPALPPSRSVTGSATITATSTTSLTDCPPLRWQSPARHQKHEPRRTKQHCHSHGANSPSFYRHSTVDVGSVLVKCCWSCRCGCRVGRCCVVLQRW
ncbi:MAG TPA: TetR/AcrR family transcriptional regulator [Streptosporangiaceae bacterium]